MNSADRDALVNGYIAACQWHWDKEGVFRKKDESESAVDQLVSVVSRDPPLAWELIRDIANQDQSEEVLDRLANGSLTTLLQSNPELLSRIEADAAQNPHIGELFSYIWDDHDFPESTWNRVLAISGDNDQHAV